MGEGKLASSSSESVKECYFGSVNQMSSVSKKIEEDTVIIKPYFRYWGKAKKADASSEGAAYHLLPFHCLDVAAVGFLLLDPEKPLCQQLANELEVAPKWMQDWFTFCLLLHDLGKYFRSFQNLAPNLSAALVPSDTNCKYAKRHDTFGYLLWKQELGNKLSDLLQGVPKSALSSWIEIVCV